MVLFHLISFTIFFGIKKSLNCHLFKLKLGSIPSDDVSLGGDDKVLGDTACPGHDVHV